MIITRQGQLAEEVRRVSPDHAEAVMAAVAECGVERESLAELVMQWRNARAIAEAQDRRLAAVQRAADWACSIEPAESLLGEAHFDRLESIADSLGRPALEAAADCAWELVAQLGERIADLAPANMQEAALKFGVLMTMLEAEDYDLSEPEQRERLNVFLEELTRLAGRTDD